MSDKDFLLEEEMLDSCSVIPFDEGAEMFVQEGFGTPSEIKELKTKLNNIVKDLNSDSLGVMDTVKSSLAALEKISKEKFDKFVKKCGLKIISKFEFDQVVNGAKFQYWVIVSSYKNYVLFILCTTGGRGRLSNPQITVVYDKNKTSVDQKDIELAYKSFKDERIGCSVKKDSFIIRIDTPAKSGKLEKLSKEYSKKYEIKKLTKTKLIVKVAKKATKESAQSDEFFDDLFVMEAFDIELGDNSDQVVKVGIDTNDKSSDISSNIDEGCKKESDSIDDGDEEDNEIIDSVDEAMLNLIFDME